MTTNSLKGHSISPSVWDNIWRKDSYSNPNLRQLKAKVKISILLEFFQPTPKWSVLDLGCGAGYLAEALSETTGCKVIGIDSSSVAIELAKRASNNDRINYFYADANKTDLSLNKFDLVICSGILEHVKDWEALVVKINSILKPNGKVFITSSNPYSFVLPHRWLKQIFGLWRYGYQKNISINYISKVLEENNIKVKRTKILPYLGDLKFVGLLDLFFYKIVKSIGRYVIIWGEKQ